MPSPFPIKNSQVSDKNFINMIKDRLNSSFILAMADSEGTILELNENFQNIFGYEPSELHLSDFQVLESDLPTKAAWNELLDRASHEGEWNGLLILQAKSEEFLWLQATVIPFTEASDTVTGILIIFNDITSRDERDTWRQIACRHDLTNLPNRRSFYLTIASYLQKADQLKTQLAILYVDLDQFKHINDTYGHMTGDEVLKGLAQRFKELSIMQDRVFHFSGDEFIILLDYLDDCTDQIEAVQAVCEEPFQTKKGNIQVHLSIGASVYPAHSSDISMLLEYADSAMFLAKQQSGSSFKLYTS